MYNLVWVGVALLVALPNPSRGQEPAGVVLTEQRDRIRAIERAAPAVVCIQNSKHRGGGSGVIIDPAGYGLTNFHVIRQMLKTRRGWGGLADGRLYELQVLGVDPTGDVAMFQLIGDDPFPFVSLGDSDAVRVGDPVIAMGDAFVLSEDFTPSVTMGMVTGLHRYQWGVGNNLIYSDSIQVDASINPGNSGGPLFNAQGEVIGINGRISVNTRGRYNVGFGYAITSNQIARFIPALRGTMLARHGTLQATVAMDNGVVISHVAPDGAAERAGIRVEDRIVSIDGIAIKTPNQFVSVMGTYPGERNVLIETQRDGERMQIVARLDPIHPDFRGGYALDQEKNMREVTRVLEAYQESVCGDWVMGDAVRLMLTKQSGESESESQARRTAEYSLRLQPSQPTLMREQLKDGSIGRELRYDRDTAQQRMRADGAWFDLPALERIVFATMYVAERIMLLPSDEIDLEGVTHVGGDALFTKEDGRYTTPPIEVEVLKWPVTADAVARFGFDRQTHRLVIATVTDKPSGMTTELRYQGVLQDSVLALPNIIEVRGGGLDDRYRIHNVETMP